MASQQGTVDFIIEQAARAGTISARKMFGEYGVYCDGKIVALVCDNSLFMKQTPAGLAFIGNAALGPPYPGAKPSIIIPEEHWEDADWMAELFRVTAAALPVPAIKRKARKSVV